MPCDFIFMLTRDDRTVPDAIARLPEVLAAGVQHIGFKDIGLRYAELEMLATTIRDAGAKSYLEVVGPGGRGEVASAEAAVAVGVDCLLGGRNPKAVLPVISGAPMRYFPFAGQVEGHPSRLRGLVPEIVADALVLTAEAGVHGVDLLAYRFDGDVLTLMEDVAAAVAKPIIVAGSIDRFERIRAAIRCGASAFTVGTAALNGLFPARSMGLEDQLRAIREVVDAESGAVHVQR